MRGHLAIRELRRMGFKPLQAWVLLTDEIPAMTEFLDPEELLANSNPPEVWVADTEELFSLDFRFLAGVIVHLQGQNIDRLRDVFAQLRRCRPARVIASGAAFFDTGAATS